MLLLRYYYMSYAYYIRCTWWSGRDVRMCAYHYYEGVSESTEWQADHFLGHIGNQHFALAGEMEGSKENAHRLVT